MAEFLGVGAVIIVLAIIWLIDRRSPAYKEAQKRKQQYLEEERRAKEEKEKTPPAQG